MPWHAWWRRRRRSGPGANASESRAGVVEELDRRSASPQCRCGTRRSADRTQGVVDDQDALHGSPSVGRDLDALCPGAARSRGCARSAPAQAVAGGQHQHARRHRSRCQHHAGSSAPVPQRARLRGRVRPVMRKTSTTLVGSGCRGLGAAARLPCRLMPPAQRWPLCSSSKASATATMRAERGSPRRPGRRENRCRRSVRGGAHQRQQFVQVVQRQQRLPGLHR